MSEDSARQRQTKRGKAALAGLLLLVAAVPVRGYEIVLRVNERIATSHDFERRRADRVRAIRNAENLPAERRQKMLAGVSVTIMNELFEELLMLSRADQLGIVVSESEVDRAINSTKENIGIETQEELEQALRSSGMTIEQLRRNARNSLMMQKLMGQEVQPRISFEEEDLRRYYQSHSEEFQEPERLHLREVVLLESSGVEGDDLRRMAEEIRQELLSGRDLEEIVEPYVQRGISSKAVDLGWVEPGDLDRELEEAVWSLEAGEVSAPVAGRGGLHVLVVSDRREAYLRSFAEAEAEIRAREGERLLGEEMQKYLEELESRAYVVANPPPEAAGFRASFRESTDSDGLAAALTAPLIAEPIEPKQQPATDQTEDEGSEREEAAPESPPDAPPSS